MSKSTGMAEFTETLRYDDLPDGVLAILRRSFLDTIGVAAIGSTTELSAIARKGAVALFGAGEAGPARMLMDGRQVSPAGAAMAGAFTIDSIDAHDGTTPNKGHAGSAIFPALLGVADALRAPHPDRPRRELTGAEFATYLAAAYEVCYRAGQAQHATCADYHTSGAWTAVGIAATCARMLGCNAEVIRHAAGIAEYHGPRSQMMRCIDFPTMVRDGVGWGAPSGVTAAYLARHGFTGAPALTCESPQAQTYWNDLGTRWLTVEHTHYKAYPCCRWAHPAMDAAAALMGENAICHKQIASVRINTFHYATRLAGHEPQTLDDLSYAIAFPVAAMIVRGCFGPRELTPETLRDPQILRLSRATKLVDDPHLTSISVAQRWAAVTLTTTDGRQYRSEPQTPRGDSDAPLSDQEISDKFHAFAEPVRGADWSQQFEAFALEFDSLNAAQFAELMDLCLGPKMVCE